MVSGRLDDLAPHFRDAAERWPDAPTLKNHYVAVAEAFEGSGHGLITTIRSFIECVCLTVLSEFGKSTPTSTPTTTQLLVEALRSLGLQSSEGGSKVGKLLSAHNKLADALSELRNEADPIAHGRDGFLEVLSSNETRAFLLTADTILALLLAAHDGTEPDLQYTRLSYDRFGHLHERIDRSVALDVEIADEDEQQTIVVSVRTASLSEGVQLRVEPSRLLFAVDRSAYVEILGSAAALIGDEVGAAEEVAAGADAKWPIGVAATPPEPIVTVSYEGPLISLYDGLRTLVSTLGVEPVPGSGGDSGLIDSLLATAEGHAGLDWPDREPLVAAMRVALRRVLIRFGNTRDRADAAAAVIAKWLGEHPVARAVASEESG